MPESGSRALAWRRSRFDPVSLVGEGERGRIAVFHNSGNRTAQAADRLLGAGFADAYLLEGGIQGWKRAGLPVIRDRRAPLPIMRQVQIAAGALVLLGVLLAVLVSPWFMALSAFVGGPDRGGHHRVLRNGQSARAHALEPLARSGAPGDPARSLARDDRNDQGGTSDETRGYRLLR